jgi:TonB family protein
MAASWHAVAAAADPVMPTSKWLVDFSEASCVASREYGTKAAPLTLAIKAPALGDSVQLAVLKGSAIGRFAVQQTGVFQAGASPAQKVSVLTYSSQVGHRQTIILNVPTASLMEAAGDTPVLSLAIGRADRLELRATGMTSLMKVVRQCVADLRVAWNVDPTAAETSMSLKPPKVPLPRAGGAKRARSSLVQFFSDDDYPADALLRNASGKVSYVLLIGADGRIADCTVMQSSGVAELDAQTCAILSRRARFTPATDASGKPVRDFVRGIINWAVAD